MIIQNKKTGQRHYITAAQWETLKNVGYGRGWQVISNEEDPPPQKVVVEPIEIYDFTKTQTKKTQNGRKRKNG